MIENTAPLFEVRIQAEVAATPEQVYAVVSDLPRSGEWSEECLGGEWISGEPGEVGSVFHGRNRRSPAVVAWAPVVRGEWSTNAEVVAADPGRLFSWAMRNHAGKVQESVWSFEIAAAGNESLLTHHFRMDSATEGILGIIADMDEAESQRFFKEWQEKLTVDIGATVDRVKTVVEKDVVEKF